MGVYEAKENLINLMVQKLNVLDEYVEKVCSIHSRTEIDSLKDLAILTTLFLLRLYRLMKHTLKLALNTQGATMGNTTCIH